MRTDRDKQKMSKSLVGCKIGDTLGYTTGVRNRGALLVHTLMISGETPKFWVCGGHRTKVRKSDGMIIGVKAFLDCNAFAYHMTEEMIYHKRRVSEIRTKLKEVNTFLEGRRYSSNKNELEDLLIASGGLINLMEGNTYKWSS